MAFEAADRLRPDYFIAWHNWIAPRDVDVVFYTYAGAGQASRRAWDVFTQHFPSPGSVGHRWDSDSNPLRHNWFGRKLGDGNVHQYALKHYGSSIWGWEMPWWGRDEGDPAQQARQHGKDFARALLATIDRLSSPAPSSGGKRLAETTRWKMHEFTLHGRAHVGNPFRDAALVGEFRAPSGKTVVAEGFHDGDDTWRLRFAPDEEGGWQYLLRGEGVELFEEGRLEVAPAATRGFIGIHPGNPYAFAHSDGTPYFPMGDTCYGLFDDGPITPDLRREYLETRRRQRFNFVRLSIGHSQYHAAADSAYWAWGGTARQPDLDRLNPIFFEGFDRLLRQMQGLGMNAEVLLFNYYRPPFTDPAQWTPARERLWLRYVIARYAAFDNVFLWTLTNEYETHPDGRYRLDLPSDVNWAGATARRIKELDPYHHPVTVHPVVSSSSRGTSPRDPFEPPWRIGGFFGEGDEIDVLTQQTSSAYPGTWDEKLNCWTGDAAGVELSVAADRKYRKPVLNSENGYEYLRGYATNRRQVHHTDKVRRAAWRIVSAGGHFAAGFISTLGHSDVWDRIDPANRHPFVVKDEGAAGQLGYLHDFFTALPFWRMQPQPERVRGDASCLALPGEVYAAYAPHGGRFSIDIDVAGQPVTRWLNPRTGEFGAARPVSSGWQQFQCPDEEDWALLVR